MQRAADKLRRVAVVLSSLAPSEAERLLLEFEEDVAEKLRETMESLELLEEDQQGLVLRDLLCQQRESLATPVISEEQPEPAAEPVMAPAEEPAATAISPNLPAAPENGWQRLELLPASLVAMRLAEEHPQTAAVVLSRLEPANSAAILREMSAELQAELLRRISSLLPIDEAALAELEAAVTLLSGKQDGNAAGEVDGLAAVHAILDAADPLHRHQLLDQLGGQNRPVSETEATPADLDRLAPTPWLRQPAAVPEGRLTTDASDSGRFVVRFEDLAQLDDNSLATVIQSVDTQLVLLALAGASRDFVDRILRPLGNREARLLQQKMQQIGPLQLQDIAKAQQLIASQAIRLALEGRITIANRKRFVMAA